MATKNVQESFTLTLKEPFSFEESTVESLTFHWAQLTGNDSLAIERELQAQGISVVLPEYSGEYLLHMAARACQPRVSVQLLYALPIGHFNKIRSAARSFLLHAA